MNTQTFIRLLTFVPVIISHLSLFSQYRSSRADSLRGALSPLRTCYDVTFYDLEVKIDAKSQRIAGSNVIHFFAKNNFQRLQIDLHQNLKIARIEYGDKTLSFEREHDAVFIDFPAPIKRGSREAFKVIYGGEPVKALNPPKDEGFVWQKDTYKNDFIGIVCESIGASSWWPLKDHLSDEPDSMRIALILPEGLMAISNGKLKDVRKLPGNFMRYEWAVSNPINSYNVSGYIGKYVHQQDVFKNALGEFRHLDFYVMEATAAQAKEHFKQVKNILRCYEQYLGLYPFWEDGFKIVESCYPSMEHQSAIAYGNGFENNEFGFDDRLAHDIAHEWFGNSLSVGDQAEKWIREAFASYMEAIYVESRSDYDNALVYLNQQRSGIKNRQPILGPLHINYDGWEDSDMNLKGSWMLHSLRNAVDDDALWFRSLKDLSTIYRRSMISTQEVIDFFNQRLEKDYSYLFEQYLTHAALPVLEYKIPKSGNKFVMEYRWRADEADFQLPVYIYIMGIRTRLEAKTEWQTFSERAVPASQFRIDTDAGLFEVEKLK